MIRSPLIATGATVGSVVKIATIAGANATNTAPRTARNTMLKNAARQTDASARSGFMAPRFWPTSVAAAFDKPHDGSSANTTIRMAMVQLATATLPKVLTIRTTPTQLLVAT